MSGMDSAKLSARVKQPGHDRSFVASEMSFIAVARACLPADSYEVLPQPRELAALFPALAAGGRALGIRPEASIPSLRSGRKFFVEVKKQPDRGNAEERACKHHTVQFYKALRERYGYNYHPFVTIFCEALATNPRYTRKAEYFFEPEQYLNWVDYEPQLLRRYLRERCAAWLD